MSSIAPSIGQQPAHVKVETFYYSVAVKPAVLAAQRQLTPEQADASNRHAAKLRAENAVLLAGPVKEGAMIRVPSWRWNPELVTLLKSWPSARFEKERPYTLDVILLGRTYTTTITMPTWTVPDAPGRIERIRAVYEQVFAREIFAAQASHWAESQGRF
jgi:hypothetical protein